MKSANRLVSLRIWNFPGRIPATNGSGQTTTERQLALRVAPPLAVAGAFAAIFLGALAARASDFSDAALQKIDAQRGVIGVVNLPGKTADSVIDLATARELTIYFQTDDASHARAVRDAAEAKGLLGSRVFVELSPLETLSLGENVADAIFVAATATMKVPKAELLKSLRPRGVAYVGPQQITKPVPDGVEDWSHPYHGPDNNPNSNDQLVRGDFRTQFVGYPKFSPMPSQTVAAGGRLYKAHGHIAHKANQNAMLNTLLCVNAYNGAVLWRRKLPEGFMIHRNTMIATDDALYMGDHESCKVFDGVTGEIRQEIRVTEKIGDGFVWKWMAMKDDILYALVGNLEIRVDTQTSTRRGLGHWPWGMWKGHDYKDPRTAFGYGRTIVAIDRRTGKQLWHYRDEEFLDARAVCMDDKHIYCYCPEKFLLCIDRKTGKPVYKSTDAKLLAEIGPNAKAQHYITGYATTVYIKCVKDQLFFSGPQRKKLVSASAKDGSLLWSYPVGNLQIVLRKDAVYAAGPQNTKGVKLNYDTGEVLTTFPARRACTRATGCVDSIFFRASGGTVRVLTETNAAQHIAPMRPPCQDGVIVSNGHLYWGPWMCGCQLSLYGNIGLAPAPSLSATEDVYAKSLVVHSEDPVKKLAQRAGDWPAYRGDNARSDATTVALPGEVELQWTAKVAAGQLPTAPVAAGKMVFIADRSGAIRALDASGKEVWRQYAAGPVYYPPTIANDRVFVGAADGRVYAFEAVSGRPLWTFRVAPADRWIPVFDRLISAWPVAGGVVVKDGVVFAAAGITHYDGTYVVSLDAASGKLLERNTTSGSLAQEVNDGVSMQGVVKIVDNELRFLGGGVYETARYDLKSLRCLNEPKPQVKSQYRTAFYPYYPAYGKYVSLEYTCGDGNRLCHDASYEGSFFGNLGLHEPLPADATKEVRDEAREFLRRRGRTKATKPKYVWQDTADLRFTSFVVTPDHLLATGHPDKTPKKSFLALMSVKDGKQLWSHDLPADAVKGGAAVDADGRIYISLENGELRCYAAK